MPQVHSVVKRAPNNTALIIEIKAPKVLATVEAWEAAACLDTTTLDWTPTPHLQHRCHPKNCFDGPLGQCERQALTRSTHWSEHEWRQFFQHELQHEKVMRKH